MIPPRLRVLGGGLGRRDAAVGSRPQPIAEPRPSRRTTSWPAWVPDAVAQAVETLLGRRASPDLDAGRVPLLVCGSCGDLACGAVTAKLDVGTSEVTWSEFRWENGHQDPTPFDSLWAPITFDRAQYETELADAAQRVAALPESEPRFLERSRRDRHLRRPWHRRKD